MSRTASCFSAVAIVAGLLAFSIVLPSQFVQVSLTPADSIQGSTTPPILLTEAGQTIVILAILCSVFATLVVGVFAKKDKVIREELIHVSSM